MLITPHRLLAPAPTLRPALVLPAPADPSTVSPLPAPFSATAGTIYCEFTLDSTAGTQVMWSLDDSGTTERITVRSSAGTLGAIVVDGGSTLVSISLGALSISTLYRVAFAWATNDFGACLNGGSVTTDTAGTLPTVNRLTVGFRSINSDPLQGSVNVIKYWPYRLPNGTLQTLR